MNTPETNPSRLLPAPALRRAVRALSLVVVLAVALYLVLVTLADRDAFVRTLAAFPPALWGQVVALSLLSYGLRFLRWQHFIAAQGHRVPWPRHLAIYLSGFALTLTPAKAGETVRSVYLRPWGVGYAQSLATFVTERLLDVAAVGALASLAVLLFPAHRFWAWGALALCLGLVLLMRSRLLPPLVARLARGGFGRHSTQGIATVQGLLSGPRLAAALPLSLAAWSAQGCALYLIVAALGYPLTAATVVGIYCLSILAGAASFIPGGLGATEAAIALLLTAAGLSPGDAIAASLVSRTLTLWLAVGLGAMAMAWVALVPHAGHPPAA